MKDLGLTLEEIHEDFEEEPVLRREKKDERGLKEEHRTFRLEICKSLISLRKYGNLSKRVN